MKETAPALWHRVGQTPWKTALTAVTVVFLSSAYLHIFPDVFSFSTKEYVRTDSDEYAVGLLTDKGERVGSSTHVGGSVFIKTQTIPASIDGGNCPWGWEIYRKVAMAQLGSDPPRVYMYDENLSTWGYNIKEYAPEIQQFLNDNYTRLDNFGYSNLYVRNDYYNEAAEKLSAISSEPAVVENKYE